MAERRMFAKTIIDSDAFLDMPSSTQNTYFHLGMRADDDGFVNNPKKIQRMIGATDDDLKLLIAKRFVIPFESGVCVIKHWKIHNYIQKDRYKETVYKDEKSLLTTKENGTYTTNLSDVDTERIQDVSDLDTQVRLGKDRKELELELVKDSLGNDNVTADKPPKRPTFKKPTLEEIIDYCNERENNVDPERFINFYISNGWKVGKNSMKDWKAAIRSWELNSYDKKEVKSKDKNPTFLEMYQRGDFNE